jgi:hypothetical protein
MTKVIQNIFIMVIFLHFFSLSAQILQYILTEGQSYNHKFGFLNVENKH